MDNVFEYTNSRGKTYFLNSMNIVLKNNKVQKIFFFSKNIRETALKQLPPEYQVVENPRTGMPVLKRVTT